MSCTCQNNLGTNNNFLKPHLSIMMEFSTLAHLVLGGGLIFKCAFKFRRLHLYYIVSFDEVMFQGDAKSLVASYQRT